MKIRYTKKFLGNASWMLAVIATLVAALFALENSKLINLLFFNCSINQSLCVIINFILIAIAIFFLIFVIVLFLAFILDQIINFAGFIKKSASAFLDKPFNIKCALKLVYIADGKIEVYIEIRNMDFLIDAQNFYFHCHFIHLGEPILDPIKWIGSYNNEGGTILRRRKKKELHFSTIDITKKEYSIHLIDRDLELPFAKDRILEFWIGGFTNSHRQSKKQINRVCTIWEKGDQGVDYEIHLI